MTALPRPGQLLTIADYAALGEDEQHRWELLEGNLIMSPSPTCHLAGGFGNQDRPAVHGVFAADEPFPVQVDLDALT